MEPLPKERSDAAGPRSSVAAVACLNGAAPEGAERHWPFMSAKPGLWSPQWSRSRRSGATRRPGAAARRGTPASMEPLPKERSDLGDRKARVHAVIGPQWSRSRRSGATTRPGPGCRTGRSGCLNGAAPEGAERRNTGAPRAGSSLMPQWSRSRRSGATSRTPAGRPEASMPQWSRSRRSGATR